jgi:acetoin utilization deacetylase AcuC-like enzyme
MLILHDPATLSHNTIELIGAKVIPALESPERISAILNSVHASNAHEVKTITFNSNSVFGQELLQILSSTHDTGYLHHLEHSHPSWVKEGLINQNESILPECFPFPNSTSVGGGDEHPTPPKDIFARVGFYAFDMSTGICAETYRSAIASANLAFDGVRILFPEARRPQHFTVLALCRPPGHHCDTRRAGGYCYINNAVVAVETFRQIHHRQHPPLAPVQLAPASPSLPDQHPPSASPSPKPRVAILDLDFHHGNGTQEAFYTDPNVLYISIHGQDEYPYYTGRDTETGAGGAVGTNLNLPLPAGSTMQQYVEKLDLGLDTLVSFKPDLVVLSLGFDTFHLDPLGSFAIETDDYANIAERVGLKLKVLSREVEGGGGRRRREDSGKEAIPCLILMEGGYVIEKLGPNLLSFLKAWEEV